MYVPFFRVVAKDQNGEIVKRGWNRRVRKVCGSESKALDEANKSGMSGYEYEWFSRTYEDVEVLTDAREVDVCS